MTATTTVCQWYKGLTPEEGARRGVHRIKPQPYFPGDRVVLKQYGVACTVVAADPMLHRDRDDDWMITVVEDGRGSYPACASSLAPLKP